MKTYLIIPFKYGSRQITVIEHKKEGTWYNLSAKKYIHFALKF